jgi:hypothetical protein
VAPALARTRLISGTVTTTSLWRVDELVYDVGHYAFVFLVSGRDTVRDERPYINIWKRDSDGAWRVWRDMPLPR